MSDLFEGNENDIVPLDQLDALLDQSLSRADTPEMVAFRQFFDGLGAQNFTADEFMVLGPSHHGNGACAGKNALPERGLWDNVKPLVAAMDAIRVALGSPVRITNCFRAEAYNSCIGGVSRSQHKQFRAADFVSSSGNSQDWADAARRVRDNGGFAGGIGIYNGFVHIDVRGSNADWDNR